MSRTIPCLRTLVLFALVTVVAPCASILAEEAARVAGFRLGHGDVIRVDVWKQPELSVSVPVRPDGMVSLPLVGEVEALGLLPSELKVLLVTLFEDYVTAPAISVVVEEINSMKVFMTGRVKQPGAYDIVQPTRILQAIALAGGLDDFAHSGRIVLIRDVGDGERQRFELSLKDITSGRSLEQDVLLQPGDTIYVP